jgi:hypothetical protein
MRVALSRCCNCSAPRLKSLTRREPRGHGCGIPLMPLPGASAAIETSLFLTESALDFAQSAERSGVSDGSSDCSRLFSPTGSARA